MEVLIALMICWVEYVFQIKQDVNLNVFNMIRINGSETLTEHILCKCKCKFNGSECNSNQE